MITVTLVADAPAMPYEKWGDQSCTDYVSLPKHAKCEYMGHLIGGCVRIKHEGREYVIHPAMTHELRKKPEATQ